MKPFIFENWHCWESGGKTLLSNELTKTLYSFWNTNEAINWLFLSGRKPAARALHHHMNGKK